MALNGITKKGNNIIIAAAALAAMSDLQYDRGHEVEYNSVLNAVRAGKFKSAKFTGKVSELQSYDRHETFAEKVKADLVITSVKNFHQEIVRHLIHEGACEPQLYADEAFQDMDISTRGFPAAKKYQVPVTVTVTETHKVEAEGFSAEEAALALKKAFTEKKVEAFLDNNSPTILDNYFDDETRTEIYDNYSTELKLNSVTVGATPKKGKKTPKKGQKKGKVVKFKKGALASV